MDANLFDRWAHTDAIGQCQDLRPVLATVAVRRFLGVGRLLVVAMWISSLLSY